MAALPIDAENRGGPQLGARFDELEPLAVDAVAFQAAKQAILAFLANSSLARPYVYLITNGHVQAEWGFADINGSGQVEFTGPGSATVLVSWAGSDGYPAWLSERVKQGDSDLETWAKAIAAVLEGALVKAAARNNGCAHEDTDLIDEEFGTGLICVSCGAIISGGCAPERGL